MNSLIHVATTIVTAIFCAAVVYSLYTAIKKRRRKKETETELVTKQHVKVDNLHQYDIAPQQGYIKYPIQHGESLRRFPQDFTALSIVLANDQPYSVCLIAIAEFDHGALKDTRYYYIQPPENDLSNVKDWETLQWETLKKADEFGEYWQAGLDKLITGRTLVAHNAEFVLGCISHALKIYGIDVPPLKYIDTLDMAKKLYNFDSNRLETICDEMDITLEEHDALSAAVATGQFLIQAHHDYPMVLPKIHYTSSTPSHDEILASLIATVEREEGTPEEMFDGPPVDQALLDELLEKKYIEPGKTDGTYYATDAGLDFSEDRQ